MTHWFSKDYLLYLLTYLLTYFNALRIDFKFISLFIFFAKMFSL